MSKHHISSAWLGLLLLGGCSQLIGLSDYGIDPALDGAAGEDAQGGDGGKAGSKNQGGEPAEAGSPGQGGKPNQGGSSGQGGSAGEAGSPTAQAGESGAAGEGGAPVQVVDCDSEDCCTELGGTPVGVELLGDGGFELGTPDDGSPWLELSTTPTNELLIGNDEFGFVARSGDWYAYLSGLAGEESTIYQTVTVPANAGWMVVSGYRLFQIDLEDEVNTDFCGIGLYDPPSASLPTGELLELPFFWSTPGDDSDGFGDTPTWKRFEASWDAAPHRGKEREIDFRGKSDEYPVAETEEDLDASSYLFDDLSLKAYHCEVPLD